MLSKTGLNATLALALLSRLQPGEYAGAIIIAKKIGAPQNYLGKLLKSLATVGLVESQKGFGGGFRLARNARSISLYDVVEPLERVSRWNGCFFGGGTCKGESPCSVHQRWKSVRQKYLQFLQETTVADIADEKTLGSA
jgi:Rrf2 family protein